jgi:hypothetical protein
MSENKITKNPEMIIAVSALFVSLVTVVISIYSAHIDRTYSRASVWPRLEVFRSHGKGFFEYGVTNNGTGPALIKYAKIKDNNKIINYWNEIPMIGNFTQSHIGTRILPSLATINPIKLTGSVSAEMVKIDENLTIELCYCSIYEECWVIDRSNNPTPVELCTINDADRFLQ